MSCTTVSYYRQQTNAVHNRSQPSKLDCKQQGIHKASSLQLPPAIETVLQTGEYQHAKIPRTTESSLKYETITRTFTHASQYPTPFKDQADVHMRRNTTISRGSVPNQSEAEVAYQTNAKQLYGSVVTDQLVKGGARV